MSSVVCIWAPRFIRSAVLQVGSTSAAKVAVEEESVAVSELGADVSASQAPGDTGGDRAVADGSGLPGPAEDAGPGDGANCAVGGSGKGERPNVARGE